MNTLEKALEISLKAHAGQRDKAGQPYILHLLRVMQQVTSLPAKIVALLHDVLENSDMQIEDLEGAGFDREILQAVLDLTRKEEEDYFEYVQRLARNPLAAQVKKADLKDNLDVSRLKVITDEDAERLNKYLKALAMLQETKT